MILNNGEENSGKLELVKSQDQEFDSSKHKTDHDSDNESIDFDAISTTSNLGRIMQRRKSLQQLAKEAVDDENSINDEGRKCFSKYFKIDGLILFMESSITFMIAFFICI